MAKFGNILDDKEDNLEQDEVTVSNREVEAEKGNPQEMNNSRGGAQRRQPVRERPQRGGNVRSSRDRSPRQDRNGENQQQDNTQQENKPQGISTMTKVVLGIAAALVLLIGSIVAYKFVENKKLKDEMKKAALEMQQKEQEEAAKKAEEEALANQDKVEDFANGITEANPVETRKIVKDEYVNAIATYTKHRAVPKEGYEFYWLDLSYRGIPYRVQVNYNVYSNINDTGEILIKMRTITFEDDTRIVDSIVISEDYSRYLGKDNNGNSFN